MMAVLELYGKCKELGYCDCGGFLGCSDPDGPGNHAPANETLALVECEVCDRSHALNHPHITNIEGDTPLDDYEPVERKADPIISVPPDDQLPEWLRDQPAAEDTEDDRPQQTCQVCGNPWVPRHASNGKRRRAPGRSTDQFRNLKLDATPAARSSAAITTARLSRRPTR